MLSVMPNAAIPRCWAAAPPIRARRTTLPSRWRRSSGRGLPSWAAACGHHAGAHRPPGPAAAGGTRRAPPQWCPAGSGACPGPGRGRIGCGASWSGGRRPWRWSWIPRPTTISPPSCPAWAPCGTRGPTWITIADCPVGRPRADSCLLACKLKRELGVEPLPHMTCRDRNLNAIKALLLGLSMEDVHNVLLVTGDPVPSESRDEGKERVQLQLPPSWPATSAPWGRTPSPPPSACSAR